MKIKLLIATADGEYAEHLSNYLSEKHRDTFEVRVCSTASYLQTLLMSNRYDAALLDADIAMAVNTGNIHLPLVLLDESGIIPYEVENFKKVHKYRRITAIVGNILEAYAEISSNASNFTTGRAHITAVWSPGGGTGKTTVALAYAANQVSDGKQVTYLNLENFSCTSAYFKESGKSISKVFEKLDANINMLLMGIRLRDSGSGISYFCSPENYDDINILTDSDIETLVNACAADGDGLVIDLPSQCDARVQRVFDLANTILIVCDSSGTAQAKLRQFISQHNVFGQIENKCVLVQNKGLKKIESGIQKTIQLPLVQSLDPVSVFKTLSGSHFDW